MLHQVEEQSGRPAQPVALRRCNALQRFVRVEDLQGWAFHSVFAILMNFDFLGFIALFMNITSFGFSQLCVLYYFLGTNDKIENLASH